MSNYGLLLRNSGGQTIFHSDLADGGGLYIGHFDVLASGGAVVVNYPAAQGRTLLCSPVGTSASFGGNPANNMSLPNCVVDYAQGYPRVTATPGGNGARCYVFADGAGGGVPGSWGLEIRNPASKLVISENFSGMHYVGNATFQEGRRWRITANTDSAILPFVVSTGYSCIECMYPVGGGTWDIFVKSGAVPSRVLVFQILGNIASGEAWSLQIRRADGSVAFDAARKPMFLRGLHDLTPYGNSGAIISKAVPSLTTPAVFCASSGVVRNWTYGNTQDVYNESILGARVVGTSLGFAYLSTYNFIQNHDYVADLAAPETLEDAISNGFAAVIDSAIY